ncbi:MAG: hypothetical protein JWO02_1609 [Solirubrobacterales bacterium]|nr:hypothetical protein [Solirubrobacterales bacterium]
MPVDFQEELDRNTFTGEHIDFDPCGRVTVNAAELSADVCYTPRFCVGNYSELGVFGIIGESTMEHFQQGVNVTGTMTIGGETITLNCRGIRDRTWGYRDEPKLWIDGVGFCATFEDFDFTAVRNVTSDGQAITDGFILSDDGALRLTQMRFTYDPILLRRAVLRFEDGSERTISRLSRQYTPV